MATPGQAIVFLAGLNISINILMAIGFIYTIEGLIFVGICLDIRASQFFQITMLIRGIVVGVKWVCCSQILLAQAYFWSSP